MARSSARGKRTSAVEILNISSIGVWILVEGKEYLAAYDDFPWFKEAKIGEILAVEMPHSGHLYWPALDIDLAVDSLESPERFPLVSKKTRRSAQ
jgi:hypothetical protein